MRRIILFAPAAALFASVSIAQSWHVDLPKPHDVLDSVPKSIPVLVPYPDHYWMLVRDMHLELYMADLSPWPQEEDVPGEFTVMIHAGFVTDFASVPRLLQGLVPRWGRHGMASILHDFLYWRGDDACTRREADHLMYLAMAQGGVNRPYAWLIHRAIRLFGRRAWRKRKRRRDDGFHGMLPIQPPGAIKSSSADNFLMNAIESSSADTWLETDRETMLSLYHALQPKNWDENDSRFKMLCSSLQEVKYKHVFTPTSAVSNW